MTLVHWRRTVDAPVSCGAEATAAESLTVAHDWHMVTCESCLWAAAACAENYPSDPSVDTREHLEEANSWRGR